jgi:Flp pilus assembly protein TadD
VTLGRNIVWADPVALWREASVRADGMWEPHYALADTLRQRGDCSAAIPEYEAVVKLRPNHRDAHTNLGICLAQMGRHEDAEQAFRRTLEIEPGFVRGHTNLGALALLNDRPDLARVHYEQALRLDPRSVLARMQLARLYETVFQDYHAAARMCGEARALNPQQPGVVECVQRNQQLAREKDAGKR